MYIAIDISIDITTVVNCPVFFFFDNLSAECFSVQSTELQVYI